MEKTKYVNILGYFYRGGGEGKNIWGVKIAWNRFGILQFFHSIVRTKTNRTKPKTGAEQVSTNIVVVVQVRSAEAVKTVAEAAPATSQLSASTYYCYLYSTS